VATGLVEVQEQASACLRWVSMCAEYHAMLLEMDVVPTMVALLTSKSQVKV
jgi:hypothetical protein